MNYFKHGDILDYFTPDVTSIRVMFVCYGQDDEFSFVVNCDEGILMEVHTDELSDHVFMNVFNY